MSIPYDEFRYIAKRALLAWRPPESKHVMCGANKPKPCSTLQSQATRETLRSTYSRFRAAYLEKAVGSIYSDTLPFTRI